MKGMLKYFLVFLTLVFIGCNDQEINSPSDNITSLPIMEIFIEQNEYDFLLKNRAFNADVSCTIKYKGELLSGEIRGAGAGSRYRPKWSYKVSMDNNNYIDGYNEFNLSAQVSDPTLLATAITSDLYRRLGFPVFNTSFVFLKINGEDKGLYPLIERVEEEFFADRNLEVSLLYKAGFESKFSLNGGYNPEFNFEKKIPDNENYNDLIEFMNAVDTASVANLETSLGKHLDLDNYIKYHAMTTLLNNIDAFTNNFFLYKKNYDSPFQIIPWDFDKAFFNEIVIDHLYGNNDIIAKIKQNTSMYKKYINEMEFQLDNIYTLKNIKNVADSVSSIIREAYHLDPYLGLGGRFNFANEKAKLIEFIIKRRTIMKELLNAEISKF